MDADKHEEYIARINRVMDYIEDNLDAHMSLDELASVACFSPYHFHRIFRAMVGETLSQFGKNGQSLRKIREEYEISSAYGGSAHHRRTWRINMTGQRELSGQIEVREVSDFTVAYLRHTGPYQGDAELFGRLFGRLMKWAGPRGLLGPETRSITVYHDDPDLTDGDKLRISVGIGVPEDTQVSGEVGKMTIRGGTYAFARFEIGADEFREAWNTVFSGWLPESGYQPADGLSYEQYHNDPEQHPEHKMIVSICVPIKPL